jgi:hypothetical protein
MAREHGDPARGRRMATSLRMVTADGSPFAILAECQDGRYLIPPLVVGPDGDANVPDEIADILDQGPLVEIPVLHVRGAGDLAWIDQTLAVLRDEHDARPWPPLSENL